MKIMICDDEIYIRDTLKQHLKEYYSSLDVLILSASSGEELLRLVEREQGDVFCIFLDIEMEGMDGLETARRLRAEYPALPILLLTSHTELALEGYEVQAFRFLAKPLRQEKLVEALRAVEKNFGEYLSGMKWVNFGGGHHITRPDYDRELLKKCIRHVKSTYGAEVYLEPGEAVALNAGVLMTEVLEIVENGMKTAILDASAACHMPDVLEMPYRPPLSGAGDPAQRGAGEDGYIYRLAGPTCLAGDVIGDYVFDHELRPGERLEFGDMAIYTMVKTNTFNGMRLPDIVLEKEDGECETVRTFGYEDFKMRL